MGTGQPWRVEKLTMRTGLLSTRGDQRNAPPSHAYMLSDDDASGTRGAGRSETAAGAANVSHSSGGAALAPLGNERFRSKS
jgi:hypothetical protein